ncbi:hypothetical protein [Streptomyces sp. NPDC059651]|uniref:hypothetical protein n=1 Tax=Streptomyces sp. NPDC059651 TaxID=3346897 RepID=UPI0036BCBC98
MAAFRNPYTVPNGAPAGSGALEAVFVDETGVLRYLTSNGGLRWGVADLPGGPYTLGGGDERFGGIVAVTGCAGNPAGVNVFWTDASGTLGQLELTPQGWSDSPQCPVGPVPIVTGLNVSYSPPSEGVPSRPVLYGAQDSSTLVVVAFNGAGWNDCRAFTSPYWAPRFNGTVLVPTAAVTATSLYPPFSVFFNLSGTADIVQLFGSPEETALQPWLTLVSPGLSGRVGEAGGIFPGGLVALTQAFSDDGPVLPACVYLDNEPDGERNLMVWPAAFTGAMALPVPNLGCRLAVAGQSVAGLNTTVYVIGSDDSVYAIPQISTCFNAQVPMMGPASQIYAGGSGTDPVQLAPDQVPGDAPALFVVGDDQSLWLYESSGRPGSYSATLPGSTGQWAGYQVRQNAVLSPVQLVSPMPAGTALPVGSSVSTPLNTMLTVQPTGLLLTAGDTPVWSVPLDGVGGAMLTRSADLTVVDMSGGTLWASGTGTSPGASLKIVDAPPSVQLLDGNGFPFWYSNRTQGPCSPGTPIAPGAQIAADGVVLVMQLDGNLVLLDRSSQPVWSTGTDGSGGTTPGHCAAFTEAGVLEVYDSTGANVLWSSADFGGGPGDTLTLSSTPEPCVEITSSGALTFRVGQPPPSSDDATGCPPGWWFTPGTGMTGDGGSQLLMQAARLLLWDQAETDYWSQPGSGAVFTTDGDLQLLDGQGAAIWKAGVNGARLIVDKSPGTLCVVDDHGNNLWTVPPSG